MFYSDHTNAALLPVGDNRISTPQLSPKLFVFLTDPKQLIINIKHKLGKHARTRDVFRIGRYKKNHQLCETEHRPVAYTSIPVAKLKLH